MKTEKPPRQPAMAQPTAKQFKKGRYRPVSTATEAPDGKIILSIALKNFSQAPIDRLWHRGRIDKRLWKAGWKFADCYYLAGLDPQVTSSYQPSMGNMREATWMTPVSLEAAVHREDYRYIVKEVGKDVAGILVALLIHEIIPTEVGRQLYAYKDDKAASAAGIAVIVLSLKVLADVLFKHQA